MTRPRAWLVQAEADLELAHRLYRVGEASQRCQVASKCQQAVEKSIKGLVDKLNEEGLVGVSIDSRHHVARYVTAITHFTITPASRGLPKQLARVFSPHRYAAVIELDQLVPQYPRPGALARRNPEYPYEGQPGDWLAPADPHIFSSGEVKRWLAAADGIVKNMRRALNSLYRLYP